SHSFLATHTGILTSKRSTSPHGLTSLHLERSPTKQRSDARNQKPDDLFPHDMRNNPYASLHCFCLSRYRWSFLTSDLWYLTSASAASVIRLAPVHFRRRVT